MSDRPDGPLFLGIDLGTSSCKVVLASATGSLVASATETYPLSILPGGGAEQDPEAWWRAVGRATRSLLAGRGTSSGRIASIGLTGQWSGTVAVGRSGEVLRPAILWMDTRGEPYVRRLVGGVPSVAGYRLDKLTAWLRKTGGAPARSGKDSLAHILYVKAREPEIYRSTAAFLEPKDYLNLRLTGTVAASYDNTVVTWVTDNRDPANVRYDRGLLHRSTIDPAKLPPLKGSTEVIGRTTPASASALGVPEGVEVVAGAGDMQASLVGTGCTRPFDFHLYLGTSSWLTAHVPFKRTDLAHNMASLPSAIRGTYLIVATQESAGSSLTYARDLLYGPGPGGPSYAELDALAERARASAGTILFTPWLYGERAPVEDRNLRGAIFNLSLSAGRGEVIRAVLEGVALNTRWILDPVERLAGRRADPIRIGGGGATSRVWAQIIADVLDRRVQVVEDPAFATARGAALLAAVGVGATTFEQIASSLRVVREHAPDPLRSRRYEAAYANYRAFHASTRRLFRRMNRLARVRV